jgi:threonylcarbamoyladenosine tRNA methylthiotransferase MtaB
VGCYAQLKPEELAAVDGWIWFLELQKNLKLPTYINDLSKMILEVHSCEIADADFYVGVTR